MSVEAVLRSRWLPALLMLGIVLLGGFYTYKVYSRTTKHKPGDFRHFYFAGEAVNEGHDIYAAGEKGYIYPPLFAVAMAPIARLDATTAERVWAVANGMLIAGIIGIAFRDAVRRFEIPCDRLMLLGVTLVALLLTVEQVRWELEMGQTDTIVLMGFTLGLFWLDRAPIAAGIALGLGANIKYQSLIAIPYLLFRRRFKAAAATAMATIGWAPVPAIVFRWQQNLSYLEVAFRGLGTLVGITSPGEAADLNPLTWDASVSLPSAAAKQLGPLGAGPLTVFGVVGLIAAAMAGACWLIFRRRGVPLLVDRSPERDASPPFSGVVALEWYGLIVAVLAFSPQAMVRHSFLLLSMNVLCAALILVPRVGIARLPLVIGLVIYQLGTKLPPGEDRFDHALAVWRSWGGASWCMLVMYSTLLWVGLQYAKAVAEGRPLLYPPVLDATRGPEVGASTPAPGGASR